MNIEKKGLLFLSYGSPSSKADLVPYMTSIRHGRVPTDAEVNNLTHRYDVIGQWSNVELQTMAERQYNRLLTLLPSIPSAIGYLHMKPSIADAVDALVKQGVEHIIAIVTAPFFTSLGTGAYEKQVQAAIGDLQGVTFDVIRAWWDQPSFIEYWVKAVSDCINDTKDVFVIFSAHSIPLINSHNADSYALALEESAKEIAQRCDLEQWSVAWQSAAPHGQWLGPTVAEVINQSLHSGAIHIAFVPFGFVSNHV